MSTKPCSWVVQTIVPSDLCGAPIIAWQGRWMPVSRGTCACVSVCAQIQFEIRGQSHGPQFWRDDPGAPLWLISRPCLFTSSFHLLPIHPLTPASVQTGVKYRDIGAVISKEAAAFDYSVVRTYSGHGIHRLFHCPPNVPHYSSTLVALWHSLHVDCLLSTFQLTWI